MDLDADPLITCKVYPKISDLVAEGPIPAVIGIDIPIGLLERGARVCDREARRILGRGRASSVFPAPIRAVLQAESYLEACQIRCRIEQKKLSRQAWGIVPKVREVDALLKRRPELNGVLREVHPEVSFTLLAGSNPIQHSKKTAEGKEERMRLLAPRFGPAVEAALSQRDRRRCAEDDVLDALVVLWTAERIALGAAKTLPASPPTDACDFRMEINV
jgi:predicted RNase H-like nuclease